MAKRKHQRRHWYFVTYEECVLCGRGGTYRERRYGRKPKNRKNRVEFSQQCCGIHFL